MTTNNEIFFTEYTYKNWRTIIAATKKGICYLGLEHSTIDELKHYCGKHYSSYTLVDSKNELRSYIEELKQYFEGGRTSFSIPFDIKGTNFQQKVWKALCDIPYGETKCYSEIAENIGNANSTRAVGVAIGKNPLSVIIPCHRVIGKNGSLTGFSGGLDVKAKLLRHEGIPYKS